MCAHHWFLVSHDRPVRAQALPMRMHHMALPGMHIKGMGLVHLHPVIWAALMSTALMLVVCQDRSSKDTACKYACIICCCSARTCRQQAGAFSSE